MGVPLENEGLIKNSVSVTLLGMPSKLPAYHQMCATMFWLPVQAIIRITHYGVPLDNEGVIKNSFPITFLETPYTIQICIQIWATMSWLGCELFIYLFIYNTLIIYLFTLQFILFLITWGVIYIYLYPGKPYYERCRQGNITWRTLMTQYRGKYRAISLEIARYFPRNWTTASLLAGYTANYTARCQSFSLPHSSGDIRGSWRPNYARR